jgi:hypothetical protein
LSNLADLFNITEAFGDLSGENSELGCVTSTHAEKDLTQQQSTIEQENNTDNSFLQDKKINEVATVHIPRPCRYP